MDRIIKKDYDWLISRALSAYEILEINHNATSDEIRKAYRKKALTLHPDKNNGDDAVEKFREISISYSILSNEQLKKIYDEQLSIGKEISEKSGDNKVSGFKNDILRKETEHNDRIRLERLKIQKIAEIDDWLNKQNTKEAEGWEVPRDLNRNEKSVFPRSIILKWKNKNGITFYDDLIVQLMEVFGKVSHVNILDERSDNGGNYHYAFVEFESPVYAALAATNDYSMTQNHWDELNLRKISSLLRSAELTEQEYMDLDPLKLSKLDYIAYCIMQS